MFLMMMTIPSTRSTKLLKRCLLRIHASSHGFRTSSPAVIGFHLDMALRNELYSCIRLDNLTSRSLAKEVNSHPSPTRLLVPGLVKSLRCQVSGFSSLIWFVELMSPLTGKYRLPYILKHTTCFACFTCRQASQQGPTLNGRRRCFSSKLSMGDRLSNHVSGSMQMMC